MKVYMEVSTGDTEVLRPKTIFFGLMTPFSAVVRPNLILGFMTEPDTTTRPKL